MTAPATIRLTGRESRSRIRSRAARHLRAPRQRDMAQWCRERLRLEKNQSVDFAGQPYDIDRAPHVRIIEEFLRDPKARELNLMKSSASGFTTFTLACLLRRLEEDPCNVLYMIGNITEAERVTKKDFQPFARQIFGEGVVDAKFQKLSHMRINGVEIWLGSPTEDQLRNKQVGIIVEDESDTMEDKLAGGGQDLETAQKERTKGTPRSKIIRLCTPIYKYDPSKPKDVEQPRTRIHRNFLSGDQREYFCPCPNPDCGRETPLRLHDLYVRDTPFEALKDPDLDEVLRETCWKCPQCGQKVREGREKERMVRAGRWKATAKAKTSEIWSARQTDLIALIGKATWGYIAREVLMGKENGKLAAVLRSHMAEPEETEGIKKERTRDVLLKHCGNYGRGEVPIMPYLTGIAADVQNDGRYFKWVKGAFTARGDLYIIDWGRCHSYEELNAARYEEMPLTCPVEQRPLTPSGQPLARVKCGRAVIDAAHGDNDNEGDPARDGVYRFCTRPGRTSRDHPWYALKGAGETQMGNSETRMTLGKINETLSVPLCLFYDKGFKRQLYLVRSSDPENPHPEARMRPRIFFPRYNEGMAEDVKFTSPEDGRDYVPYDEFIGEMLAERYVRIDVKKKGRKKSLSDWTVPHGLKNDFGDCVKMLIVMHQMTLNQQSAAAA